jgi:hypothetical protein
MNSVFGTRVRYVQISVQLRECSHLLYLHRYISLSFGCHRRSLSCTRRTVSGKMDSVSFLTTVAALEDAYADADLFERIRQIRGRRTGCCGLCFSICFVVKLATLDEQALFSFTLHKLQQFPTSWDLGLASEWNKSSLTLTSSKNLWRTLSYPKNENVKPYGARNTLMLCYGSKRAAPELRFA